MRRRSWKKLVLAFLSDEGEGGRGQAMVEFAIAFPLQLFITFGIMQMALLSVAELVTNYAAFRACRAALVTNWDENLDGRKDGLDMQLNARKAAAMVLFPLAMPFSGANDADSLTVPGWGKLKNSDSAFAKLKVYIDYNGSDTAPADVGEMQDLTVVVEWDQELIFPVVDSLFAIIYGTAGRAQKGDDDKSFGKVDGDYNSSNYANRPSFYRNKGSLKGPVRLINGRYHIVIVKQQTMYRRQGWNNEVTKVDTGNSP